MVRFARYMLAACLCLPVVALGQASTFPMKPITWVVGFPPGGGVDAVSRLVAAKMAQNIGQSVLIENRPGASSIIAAQYVTQAPADGYTLLSVEQGVMVFNAAMYSKLPYVANRDFAPITNLIFAPLVLSVKADFPANDFASFIEEVKKNPTKYDYGSPGRGLAHNIAMEVLKERAGLQVPDVQYKGIAPVIQDLTAGQSPLAVTDTVVVLPHLKSGKIRALATFSTQRLSVTPDVPALAELGYPGLDIAPIVGVATLKATPPEIIAKLNLEIVRALRDPGVSAKLLGLGLVIVGNSPEQFAEFLASEEKRWLPIVKKLDIHLD